MSESRAEITRLVREWSDGDEEALHLLVEQVYPNLRRIARHHLANASHSGTLSTTVLVHEAYLKLAGISGNTWRDRTDFFAFCSKAMRHILIDFARRRNAAKRGGNDAVRVALTEHSARLEEQSADLLTLDEALTEMAERHPRMASIVECRFFGGMTVPETAEALSTSVRTVEREWPRARAYLQRALEGTTRAGADGAKPEHQ